MMKPKQRQQVTGGRSLDQRRMGLATSILFCVFLSVGCGQRRETNLEEAGEPVETWDVLYAEDTKIGHAHSVVARLKETGGDGEFVRTTSGQVISIRRFGQETKQSITMTTVETASGELIEFRTDYKAGPNPTVTTGRVNDDRLEMEIETKGKVETASIFWEKKWGGFFAIEQSLAASPMQAGESRSLRVLQPVMNQPAKVTLKAVEVEDTEMLAGSQKLLRIEASIHVGGQTIPQVMWTDKSGEVLKSEMPGIGFVAYRTTKEIALRESESGSFDLGEKSMVHVDRKLENAHATKRIKYRAHVTEGKLAGVFASGISQSVKKLDDKSVEISVQAVRPNQPKTAEGNIDNPTDDDLNPNGLIQSDDELIKRMAAEVLPDKTDSWLVAKELESYVNEKIEGVNFSQALASASDVAETLEGDCTEHAVLLAALCRARTIPARVAIGLVYFRSAVGEGFGYHMWTEVWIKDRWVPLDATLGRGGIGAAHIKIAHTNLKGASAYSAFLPVVQVIGRLRLEITQVE